MRRLLLALLLVASLAAAARADQIGPPQGRTARDLTAVLKAQADAWNRGDLKAFMTAYVRSADMTYTAAGKVVYGYDALEKRYKKRYGGTPQTMGRLRFDDIAVSELGAEHALMMGRWFLHRDGRDDIDGVFSLVWRKTPAGWKILHDHSSLRAEPARVED